MNLPPFQHLVDAHWRDVARLAHALAGPVDGPDVAQQAWTQALAAYPTLRSGRNLKAWLLTITSRCATDVHRARGRRAVPVAEPSDGDARGRPHAGHGGTSPSRTSPGRTSPGAAEASSDPTLTDPDLWTAVAALPERQRTAVVLRYVADLDHAAVAAALDTTPAATRRLVSDALTTLRRSIP